MTTNTTSTGPVQRGNGTAVHAGIYSDGRLIATYCVQNPNACGRQHLALHPLPAGTPVTCGRCLGDDTPAPSTPAPETCDRHHARVHSVRTIKAGVKTTWTCGCTHLQRR